MLTDDFMPREARKRLSPEAQAALLKIWELTPDARVIVTGRGPYLWVRASCIRGAMRIALSQRIDPRDPQGSAAGIALVARGLEARAAEYETKGNRHE